MSNRHGKLADNKDILSVNIEKAVKEDLAQLAKDENRTLSNYVATELAKLVAKAKRAKAKPPNRRRHSGVGPTSAIRASA